MNYYSTYTSINYFEPSVDYFFTGNNLVAVDVFSLIWFNEEIEGVIYLN